MSMNIAVKTTKTGNYILRIKGYEISLDDNELADLREKIEDASLEHDIINWFEDERSDKYDVNAIASDENLICDIISYYGDVKWHIEHTDGDEHVADVCEVMREVEKTEDIAEQLRQYINPNYED